MFNKIKKRAIKFCLENNHRLTDPRLNVLEIIYSSQKPIKAYTILNLLGKKIKNPKPPTAYRAIDFWSKHNFIHRIESLNAYTYCSAGHFHKGFQYMLCNACGKVIESHFCELPNNFKEAIEENTFKLSNWNLEIKGICNNCN